MAIHSVEVLEHSSHWIELNMPRVFFFVFFVRSTSVCTLRVDWLNDSLVGWFAGKSSIVKRYVDDEFRANYLFTIGGQFFFSFFLLKKLLKKVLNFTWWTVDFALKTIQWSPTELVKLQVRPPLSFFSLLFFSFFFFSFFFFPCFGLCVFRCLTCHSLSCWIALGHCRLVLSSNSHQMKLDPIRLVI